jgi:hypothetical protein
MAAGPELTTTYADLLLEMKGPLVENYPKYSVLLSELKRNTDRKNFQGTSVRVPIIRNVKQGTGPVAESGLLNVARNIRTQHANIGLATVTHAVQISKRLKAISAEGVASWGQAMKLEMQLAEEAMPRITNEFLNGDGTGLLASINDTATSTSHVVSGGNFYQLYPGRVVDVLVRSSGATVTLANEIASVTESTLTVTFTTSFTGATTQGIYIEGSQPQTAGYAPQGFSQATAASGSFQGLTIGTDWQAVDGRNADTSTADLSISIMDGCIRRRGRNGRPNASFWIGDPAVLDKFGQTLITQSRWDGTMGTLETGWEGIKYRSELLIPEYDAKANRVLNVPTDDVQFYATGPGPDWDDEDGSVFKRFARSLPVEAWLVDEFNLGFYRLNRLVYADNLAQAS